jgi:hypothetical protein
MYDIGLKIAVEDSSVEINDVTLPDLFFNMNLTLDSDVTEYAGVVDESILPDTKDVSPHVNTPVPPKRITSSARESPLELQTAGIRQLQEDMDDKKIASDPTGFGFDSQTGQKPLLTWWRGSIFPNIPTRLISLTKTYGHVQM